MVGFVVLFLVGITGSPRGCEAEPIDVDVVGMAGPADAELVEVVVGIEATPMECEVPDVISRGKNPFEEFFEVLAMDFGDMKNLLNLNGY